MRIAIIATPLHNMKYRDFINSRRKEWNSCPVGYLHYFIVIYLEMSKIHLDESGKRLLRDLKKLKRVWKHLFNYIFFHKYHLPPSNGVSLGLSNQ